MADEKSIVKMNKMIHNKMNKMIHTKTGASFLVVYVIYVSLVYTDSKKTASCLLPQHTIFATFGRQLKCLLVRIQGGLYLFHYVLDNLIGFNFFFVRREYLACLNNGNMMILLCELTFPEFHFEIEARIDFPSACI